MEFDIRRFDEYREDNRLEVKKARDAILMMTLIPLGLALTIAVDGDKILKISVKGSQDGGWGLTQGYKKGCDYHEATAKWLAAHHKKTIFCLVQFLGVSPNEMPHIYLASPQEIADILNASAGGRGETVLRENHTWGPRAVGKGTTDRIPDKWVISAERLQEMFNLYGQ